MLDIRAILMLLLLGMASLSSAEQRVSLYDPNSAGITWAAGSIQTVTWSGSNGVTSVDCELSVDDGGTWTTLVANRVPGDSVNFTNVLVPNTATTTARIRMRVSGSMAAEDMDVSDNPFTITAAAGPILAVLRDGDQPLGNGNSISFDTLASGTVTIINLTLKNAGSGTINGVDATLTPAGADPQWSMQATGLPTSLAAGAVTTISVALTPATAGATSAHLAITSDLPTLGLDFIASIQTPGTLAVSFGVDPDPLVPITDGDATPSVPDGTDFGVVPAGDTIERQFTLSSTGPNIVGLTVAVTGAGFTVSPATTSVFGTQTLTISFTPASAALINGTVTLDAPTMLAPFTFAVSGSGEASPGTASFITTDTSLDERSPLAITLRRNGGSAGILTVPVTVGGTATRTTDYAVTTGGADLVSVTWGDGDTTDKTIDLVPVDDGAGDAEETVVLTLGAGSSAPASVTITLTEANPGLVSFVTMDAPLSELAQPMNIILRRSGGNVGALTVPISVAGTATRVDDFSLSRNGNDLVDVSWADGDMADKTVVLTPHDDLTSEGDETVLLTIGGPRAGAQSTLTITLVDPMGLRPERSSYNVTEGAYFRIYLGMGPPLSGPLDIVSSRPDVIPVLSRDEIAYSWNLYLTVPHDDNLTDETFTITLTGVDVAGGLQSVAVTSLDTDLPAGFFFAPNRVDLMEGDSGVLVISKSADAPSGLQVLITASLGNDYPIDRRLSFVLRSGSEHFYSRLWDVDAGPFSLPLVSSEHPGWERDSAFPLSMSFLRVRNDVTDVINTVDNPIQMEAGTRIVKIIEDDPLGDYYVVPTVTRIEITESEAVRNGIPIPVLVSPAANDRPDQVAFYFSFSAIGNDVGDDGCTVIDDFVTSSPNKERDFTDHGIARVGLPGHVNRVIDDDADEGDERFLVEMGAWESTLYRIEIVIRNDDGGTGTGSGGSATTDESSSPCGLGSGLAMMMLFALPVIGLRRRRR